MKGKGRRKTGKKRGKNVRRTERDEMKKVYFLAPNFTSIGAKNLMSHVT